MGDSDQAHLAAFQLGVEPVEVELTVAVDRQVLDLRARLLAEQLPGHDVGVVLHLGQQHHVATADVLARPGVAHQVDRLGGVANEHDLLRRRRADETGQLRPGALVERGGLGGELMHAAVDVRVG